MSMGRSKTAQLFQNFEVRRHFSSDEAPPLFHASVGSINEILHLPGLIAALPDDKVVIAVTLLRYLQAPLCLAVLDRSVLGINAITIKAPPLPWIHSLLL